MQTLTLAEILAANDTRVEFVDCPEWGGRVYLRNMDAAGRDKIDAQFGGHGNDPEKLTGMRAAVVAYSLCDESGNFQYVAPEQIEALSHKSQIPMDRCYMKCVELSGLQANAVETAVKN